MAGLSVQNPAKLFIGGYLKLPRLIFLDDVQLLLVRSSSGHELDQPGRGPLCGWSLPAVQKWFQLEYFCSLAALRKGMQIDECDP